MAQYSDYTIFISHASEDAFIAKKLQIVLELALKPIPGQKLVFRSTDITAIEGGFDWYECIIDALRKSKVCLSLVTPTSISKAWVLYETGGAYSIHQNNESVIPLCALGISSLTMPLPLKRLQYYDLSKIEYIGKLLNRLKEMINTTFKTIPTEEIEKLSQLCSDNIGGWESVQLCRLAINSNDSPFRYDRAISRTKEHIFFAGQNLHSIANQEQLKSLEEFIGVEGRHVDILISDYSIKSAIKVWSRINPEMREKGYTYKKHLESATNEFKVFLNGLSPDKRKRIKVKVFDLVAFNATIIDPDSDSSILVLHSTINHGPKSMERPQIIISKRDNKEAFDYYWHCISTTYEVAHDLIR
jgi:hypothetical protein